MGGGFNDGIDPEKSLYLPGIYDSVTLIATGGHYVENIQVAPKISESKARVVAEIRNFADNPRKANDRRLVDSKTKHYKPFDVSVQIFERASKKLVASKK